MGKTRDITGQKFGRLTAIEFSYKVKNKNCRGYKNYWLFKCDCGKETIKRKHNVLVGDTTSCGCLSSRHTIGDRNRTHGMSGTRFQTIFQNILLRCNNKKDNNYKKYGAKGIKCFWNSFQEFINDMYKDYIDHLEKFGEKNTQIDRINNYGHYCKNNCRWVTIKEQARNKKQSIILEFNGKKQHLLDWARDLNIKPATLRARIYSGWSIKRILTEPSFLGKNQSYK